MARISSPRSYQPNRSAGYPNLQHVKYQGIDCVLIPVMLEGKQRIGTVWLDDKDDLELRREVTLPGSHTVTELTNIVFDPNDNASQFRVPAGFTIDASRMKTISARN